MDNKTQHLLYTMALVKHQQSRSDDVNTLKPSKNHLWLWIANLAYRFRKPKRKEPAQSQAVTPAQHRQSVNL